MTLEELDELKRKEALEHHNAKMDIRALLSTSYGRRFVKYLFKSFDVGELPEFGAEGLLLHERIGMLRAGRAIFEIVSEADCEVSAKLLAEIQKEKNEKLYAEFQDGPE